VPALDSWREVTDPTFRRATFWATSGRIVDDRMTNHVEVMPDPRPVVQGGPWHMEQDKAGTWRPTPDPLPPSTADTVTEVTVSVDPAESTGGAYTATYLRGWGDGMVLPLEVEHGEV
jgi:hypothetical protein